MGIWRAVCISFLISASYAHAGHVTKEQCTDTDIRETNPKIKNDPQLRAHFSTPRDQDSIGWCYGFVAADLVSAEIGEALSASHVSNIYNENIEKTLVTKKVYDFIKGKMDRNPHVYEGGFVGKAVKQLVKKGRVCRESDFPFDQVYPNQLKNLINQIEYIKETAKSYDNPDEVACISIETVIEQEGFGKIDFSKLSKNIAETSVTKIMSEMADQKCKDNQVEIPKLKTKRILQPQTKWGTTRYFNHINKALDKGKPVSFMFDSKHVSKSAGPHVVSAIGRRWKNGKCEYKIRNSWGKSCATYLENIECNREEGTFWMSDELIKKHVWMTNYIQD